MFQYPCLAQDVAEVQVLIRLWKSRIRGAISSETTKNFKKNAQQTL